MLEQVGERKSKHIHITKLWNENKNIKFPGKDFLHAVIKKLMHIMRNTEMAQIYQQNVFLILIRLSFLRKYRTCMHVQEKEKKKQRAINLVQDVIGAR